MVLNIKLSLLFVVSSVAIISTAPTNNNNNAYVRASSDDFNETIEFVRTIMKNGYPSLKIPVLDPFSSDYLPIKFDFPMAKADVVFRDILGQGLSDFVAYKIEIDPNNLQLRLGIKLNSLKGYFLYDGTMTVFDFIPLFGKGNAFVRLDGYDVDIEIKFKKTDDGIYLKCDNVNMNFSMESCDFQISGLLNNEEASKLISKFITDMVPTFIKDHETWMNNTYSPIVATIVDMLNIEAETVFG